MYLYVFVQVSDADIGVNGQVDFSLSATARGFFSLSVVQAFVAELSLSHSLDREETDYYNFQIFAADRGVPSLIGETDITIIVSVSSYCMHVYE